MIGVFEKKTYFQLSCLRVRGFQRYIPMFHPHAELVYVVEGRLGMTVEGVYRELEAGELAVVFPYLTHSYENAPDAEVLLLMFDPAATVFDNTLLSRQPGCFYQRAEDLQPMLERAVELEKIGRFKTAMSYLNAVLGELFERMELVDRGSARGVTTQILAYCAEHYAEDISVKTLADALYVSESYVSKVFAQKLGYSFREYINALRVHKAQILLRETDRKILEVMTACGFRNQSSFNRIFREATGLSPREYREK